LRRMCWGCVYYYRIEAGTAEARGDSATARWLLRESPVPLRTP
jgi:hypothetical protein